MSTIDSHNNRHDSLGQFAGKVGTRPPVGALALAPAPTVRLARNQYGTVFTAAQVESGAAGPLDQLELFDDELLRIEPDERIDLEEVRTALAETPGSGPHIVDAALDSDDPTKLNVSTVTGDNLLWRGDFTEEELDEHRDIVEAIYLEWFDAEIDVPDTWENFDVTLRTQVPADVATEALITDRAWNGYAKFLNETDPGTYGSPYVGGEIRRRIDERVEATKAK